MEAQAQRAADAPVDERHAYGRRLLVGGGEAVLPQVDKKVGARGRKVEDYGRGAAFAEVYPA